MIQYIDELDEEDNVYLRMEGPRPSASPAAGSSSPMEWLADGTVLLTLFFPVEAPLAEAAALETGKRLGLHDCEVISREIMHPKEGTRIEMKGKVGFSLNIDELHLPAAGDAGRG